MIYSSALADSSYEIPDQWVPKQSKTSRQYRRRHRHRLRHRRRSNEQILLGLLLLENRWVIGGNAQTQIFSNFYVCCDNSVCNRMCLRTYFSFWIIAHTFVYYLCGAFLFIFLMKWKRNISTVPLQKYNIELKWELITSYSLSNKVLLIHL